MPKDLSEEQMALLSQALENGRKIEAIKVYRKATGLGLKEAMDAVEKIHADLREQFPERYPAPSKSVGYGPSAALFTFGLGLVYLILQLPA